MTVAEMETTISVDEYDPNPANNRCDKCGARAYIRFYKSALQLEWCGHHGNFYAATLIADGWTEQSRIDKLEAECDAYKKVADDKF